MYQFVSNQWFKVHAYSRDGVVVEWNIPLTSRSKNIKNKVEFYNTLLDLLCDNKLLCCWFITFLTFEMSRNPFFVERLLQCIFFKFGFCVSVSSTAYMYMEKSTLKWHYFLSYFNIFLKLCDMILQHCANFKYVRAIHASSYVIQLVQCVPLVFWYILWSYVKVSRSREIIFVSEQISWILG